MPAYFRLVSEIFESRSYPIVTHIFTGQTLEEALGYYRAHLQTDAFLSACATAGHFRDFNCRATLRSERWTGRHWVKI